MEKEIDEEMDKEDARFNEDDTLQKVIEDNMNEEVVEGQSDDKVIKSRNPVVRVQAGGEPAWYDKDTT